MLIFILLQVSLALPPCSSPQGQQELIACSDKRFLETEKVLVQKVRELAVSGVLGTANFAPLTYQDFEAEEKNWEIFREKYCQQNTQKLTGSYEKRQDTVACFIRITQSRINYLNVMMKK